MTKFGEIRAIEDIVTVSEQLKQELQKKKLEQAEITNALLLLEETVVMQLEHTPDTVIQLQLGTRFGELILSLRGSGEEYNPLEIATHYETEEANRYRQMIFQANQEKLSYSRKNGRNTIFILVHSSGKKKIYYTLSAMALGMVAGLLLKQLAPETVAKALDYNVLQVIKTLFLNAMKLMIAPVVFFSIANSIGGISDVSEVGRMGGKLLAMYMLTTVIAIALGFGIATLVFAGDLPAVSIAAGSYEGTTATVAIRDTIVGIVPSDLVSPIMGAQMLQIIFVAVLFGVGVGKVGERVRLIADFMDAMNTLSLQLVSILVRFIPIATFCAMASMMINMGISSLLLILRLILGIGIGWVAILLVYGVLLGVFGHMSPLPFLRKILPFLPIPFSLCSSNATIPFSMGFCKEKIGVDDKLSSFSIPIGATINMDGSCIFLVLGSIMFLKMYGVELDLSVIFTIAVSTFVLSVGAPGVQGGGIICLSTLVSALGIPIECIGLVLGIDQLSGMIRTSSNVAGDIAVTTLVAKGEKLLDMDVYNS